MRACQVICIGTSAGGVQAIQRLLSELRDVFLLPTVIVQHLPAHSVVDPRVIFGAHTQATLLNAFDKVSLEKGHVYFASPDYHLLIEKNGQLSFEQDRPVHFSRPSIDVLFETAALAFGEGACGVLLTGANSDGAEGLKAIQDHGGYTMVQSPDEAECKAMPLSAIKIMVPNLIANLAQIAQRIRELCEESQ